MRGQEEEFHSNSNFGAVPEEEYGYQVACSFDVRMKEVIAEFEDSFAKTKEKIHRLPPSQYDLHQRYTVPMAVGIGPYHSGSTTRTMMTAKDVALYYFSKEILRSTDDLLLDFISGVGDVRSLYLENDPDFLATVGSDPVEFNRMMLRDGCFLLQYMLAYTTGRDKMPPSLVSFFDSNEAVISNDIMLLENQLPWVVIQTLRRIKDVPVEEFIAKMGRTLQLRKEKEEKPFSLEPLDSSYTPPHLLGLLHLYKSGINIGNNQKKSFSLINYCCYNNGGVSPSNGSRPRSRTTSAIELAEIGIKLKPSRTAKFIDMGIKKKLFSGDIFLAPLLLDEIRACWLLNLAAFELCMGEIFENKTENYVVGSYLAVFAMLMDREEDVHKLRSKRLIQGELTNKEILDLFKGLTKRISGGLLYENILEEIEDYKLKRWIWIKVHEFFYKNKKTIVAVLSIIGVLVGIFKALLSLKHH